MKNKVMAFSLFLFLCVVGVFSVKSIQIGDGLSSSIQSVFDGLKLSGVKPLQTTEVSKKKIGVVLLNLGGPETQKDVKGFLYNLFADPDIIRLPCSFLRLFQKPLAFAISQSRGPKSALAYQRIGGGSPIVKYTDAQSKLLQELLEKRGIQAKCTFAMRYWHPFTAEALSKLENEEIDQLVILPLYPQYSISTTASSLKALREEFSKPGNKWSKIPHTVIPFWHVRPEYINTMATLIIESLRSCSPSEIAEGVHVLFSAHGVPQSYIAAGDPYQAQMCECATAITAEIHKVIDKERASPKLFTRAQLDSMKGVSLGSSTSSDKVLVSNAVPKLGDVPLEGLAVGSGEGLHFHLSFQSRVGPVQWLRPYTDDVIRQLGKASVKNLVVVPIAFVSEHIETLEEIDIEYRELAEASGIHSWRRTPALNTHPLFIECLANLVADSLVGPTFSLDDTIVERNKCQRRLMAFRK